MAKSPLPRVWCSLLLVGFAAQLACSQRGKEVNSQEVTSSDADDNASHDGLLDETHPPDARQPDVKEVFHDIADSSELVDPPDTKPDAPDSLPDATDISDTTDSLVPDLPTDVPDLNGDTGPDTSSQPVSFGMEGFSAGCGIMQSSNYKIWFRLAPSSLAVTQESKNQNYTIRPISKINTGN